MNSAEYYKQHGDACRDSGNLGSAIKNYNKAIGINADYWQAHANLSMLLAQIGDDKLAIEHAKISVEIVPSIAELHDNLGSIYRLTGHYNDALSSYSEALSIDPNLLSALHNSGLVHAKLGHVDMALKLLKHSVLINDNYPESHVVLGDLYVDKKDYESAYKSYKKANILSNGSSDLHIKIGLVLYELGEVESAINSFRDAVKDSPDPGGVYFNLGVLYRKEYMLDEALHAYEKAIEYDSLHEDSYIYKSDILREIGDLYGSLGVAEYVIGFNPKSYKAHTIIGNILSEQGDFDGAVCAYQNAIHIFPEYKEAHNGLGAVLTFQGKYEKSIDAYNHAIEIDRHYKEAYNGIGNTFKAQGRFNDAIRSYNHAIEIDRHYKEAYNGLGNVFRNQGRLEDAIKSYNKVVEIDHSHKGAYNGLGNALKKQGKIKDAIASYERAIEIDPNNILLAAPLFDCFRLVCDWKHAITISDKLDTISNSTIDASNQSPLSPFISIYRESDPVVLLDRVVEWSSYNLDKHYQSREFSFSDQCRDASDQIKVGYISHDFRNHPVGILVHNLFKHHDRTKFQIFIYSYGPDDGSDFRSAVISGSDHFCDMRNMSHLESATRIFDDQIDILVDLTGFTEGGRYEICAYKPAPIQVNYLGFPGSSGSDFFDYIITDHILTPVGFERFFSEKLVRLPDCYQVNSQEVVPDQNGYVRADFSLPDDEIVFCSFNNSRKIDEVVFNSWMNILKEVNGSVLWLHTKSPLQVENLRVECKNYGINPDRLVFAETLPIREHLERHKLADIALDTFVYNGGLTTSLALSSNVPVVTLQGDRYVSRMSSSLINTVSLPELITCTASEYEDMAIELAKNPELLLDVKNRLSFSVKEGPLFNAGRFTANLEKSFMRMWSQYCNGNKPCHIDVH